MATASLHFWDAANVLMTAAISSAVESDKGNRKGALTGGFIDVRTSRIEAMRTILTIRDKLKELTANADKLQAAIQGKPCFSPAVVSLND